MLTSSSAPASAARRAGASNQMSSQMLSPTRVPAISTTQARSPAV